jgi:hypothetical protein
LEQLKNSNNGIEVIANGEAQESHVLDKWECFLLEKQL